MNVPTYQMAALFTASVLEHSKTKIEEKLSSVGWIIFKWMISEKFNFFCELYAKNKVRIKVVR